MHQKLAQTSSNWLPKCCKHTVFQRTTKSPSKKNYRTILNFGAAENPQYADTCTTQYADICTTMSPREGYTSEEIQHT